MREYDPAMQVEYAQQLQQYAQQQVESVNIATNTNQEGDFSTILSSEMISDIVQDYMNKKMYRRPVKVVDLQPTPNGYMFILAYVQQNKYTPPVDAVLTKDEVRMIQQPNIVYNDNNSSVGFDVSRDSKGKLAKTKKG